MDHETASSSASLAPAPPPAGEQDEQQEEALFLETPPPSPPADILALFNPSPPASPSASTNEWTTSIDIAALERAALRKAQAQTQHEVLPSSSPPRRPRSASPKGKNGGKKRARPRILDESRLMDEQKGFPRLIRDMQGFKVKGKGHEASDLNRLMSVYQYWIHDLYPREQFKDTVGRVERMCHSRRMNSQLSSWRDGKGAEDEEDEVVVVEEEEVAVEEPPPSSDGDMVGRVMELDGDDLFDSSPPPPQPRQLSAPPAPPTANDDMLLDDDELDALIQQAGGAGDIGGNNDEDDWDALDEMEGVQNNNTTTTKAPQPPPVPPPDDDWLEYA